MAVNSYFDDTWGCSSKGRNGIECQAQNHLIWLKLLFSLVLFCCLSDTLEANDIRISGLNQAPTNPIPVAAGTTVSFNLTTRNVYDGVNPSSRIGVGIMMSVDGVTVRADSGQIEAAGCSVDPDYPSSFACQNLSEGGTQSPTFVWLNPTPGQHTVTFNASCQLLPAQSPPSLCPSFGTSLSTTTQVGINPTAVLNPAGPTVTTMDDTPTISFDGRASTDQDGNIVSCGFSMDGAWFVNAPDCIIEYNTPAPGNHTVALRVTDSDGLTDVANLNLRVLSYPEAVAGGDQQLVDRDNNGSEMVTLDASGSSDVGGNALSYAWFTDVSDTPVATGVTASLPLAVGSHNITLRVTDDDEMVTEDSITVTILPAPAPPAANAGLDQQLTDNDNDNSESVHLDGTGSRDSDGAIVGYQWLEFGSEIATGASPSISLPVGNHILTLRVTDNDGAVGEDQVTIEILPGPNAPNADAGQDISVTDTDSNGSEQISIDGSGSSDSDGTIVSYLWLENGSEIANGAAATVTLAVGVHSLTLRVTDDDDLVSEDQLTVTISADAEAVAPVANAGTDQSLVDTDGDGSATVTLDGSASSDADGTILSYVWYEGSREIANGVTAEVVLTTGTHILTLLVTDDTQLTHQDQVRITLSSDKGQLQIVSGDTLVGSSGDTLGPFTVRLVDPAGSPLADRPIAWRVIPEDSATLSETESITDADGRATTAMTVQQTGVIKLIASLNDNTTEFVINSIAQTPGLTDNQEAVGSSLDNLCLSLGEKQTTGSLSAAEQDLLMTCNNLVSEPGTAETLTRLAPEEVATQGAASIEAAGTQLGNVNTRLVALRAGDTGMNLSGLNVNYAGIAFNRRLFDGLLPEAQKVKGGSAGDIDALQGRWGAFINGSIDFGEKDQTERETGFEFDTRGITLGLDYRFNPQFVAGGAMGFSRYNSDYNDATGDLEMDAWSLSAYATYYQDNNVYVDGLVQYGSNSYDTQRRINGVGAADQFAEGNTEGMEYSFNLSAGYDYRYNEMTLTPYGRFSYTHVEIDAYTEEASDQTAAGFGSVLHIEDQDLESRVLVLGGNFTYSYSTLSGVLIPQLRFEWEHEFKDDSRDINAGFVHDPTRSQFTVETDYVDKNYFNLGLGLSAVFSHGKTAYVFYERRIDQDNITLNRINAGIRLEF